MQLNFMCVLWEYSLFNTFNSTAIKFVLILFQILMMKLLKERIDKQNILSSKEYAYN